jgi:hypothetical protein
MKKSMLITALGMVIAMQSATVLAGKQLYPGAMCVRWTEGDVVPMLNHSRIFNTSSTTEMRVDCPILHQNFNSTWGNNLDDADIGVINDNPSMDTTCWLASRYQDGSVLKGRTHSRVTVGHGDHEQNLDFGGTGRHADNWYYIGCEIPRSHNGQRSGITYYSAED